MREGVCAAAGIEVGFQRGDALTGVEQEGRRREAAHPCADDDRVLTQMVNPRRRDSGLWHRHL